MRAVVFRNHVFDFAGFFNFTFVASVLVFTLYFATPPGRFLRILFAMFSFIIIAVLATFNPAHLPPFFVPGILVGIISGCDWHVFPT